MCDVQGKLIAWLDLELPTAEANEVERHIEQCRECQRWVATYGHVSETFDAYCDAVMVAKEPRRVSRWVPVLASSLGGASGRPRFSRRQLRLLLRLFPRLPLRQCLAPASRRCAGITWLRLHALRSGSRKGSPWTPLSKLQSPPKRCFLLAP